MSTIVELLLTVKFGTTVSHISLSRSIQGKVSRISTIVEIFGGGNRLLDLHWLQSNLEHMLVKNDYHETSLYYTTRAAYSVIT